MNRVSSMILCGALILAIPAISKARPSIVVAQTPSSAVSDQVPHEEELQIFAGTIISMDSGMFFLRDDTKGTLYGLDNQALARKFADKKVLVTGSLDKTGIIRIKNIEEQKT